MARFHLAVDKIRLNFKIFFIFLPTLVNPPPPLFAGGMFCMFLIVVDCDVIDNTI